MEFEIVTSLNPKWPQKASDKDSQHQWIEAEAMVLDSLISDWSSHSSKVGWTGLRYQLTPEHFLTNEGRFFYNVLISARDRAVVIDSTNVFIEECSRFFKGKTSDLFIAALPLFEVHVTDINYWCRRVIEGALTRRLDEAIRASQLTTEYEARDRVRTLEESLKSLKESDGFGEKDYVSFGQAMDNFLELLETRMEGNEVAFVPSGWPSLDSKLKFGKSHLIIIAGRSGMGKTVFAMNTLRHMVLAGLKVGFFSIEMRESAVVQMLCSIHSGVEYSAMNDPQFLTEQEMDAVVDAYRAYNPFRSSYQICDKSRITIASMRMNMEAMKRDMQGLDAVFLDHMHVMADDKNFKSVREKMMFISQELKAIAKDFDIPVIALAQMNREADKRQDKRPQIADLKESGSLEQDADSILFCYHDSYYASAGSDSEMSMEFLQAGNKGSKKHPFNEIICRKNRHGSHSHFTLYFEHNQRTKSMKEVML